MAFKIEFARGSRSFLATVGIWLTASLSSVRAEIVLPSVMGDHMVLQQGMAAPIWGQASPGETIVVKADWRWRKTSTVADEHGKWLVRIPTPKPGQAHVITISGGQGERVVLHDVLIGEVWLCSGQSNMEMPVGDLWGGYNGVDHWQEVLQQADIPEIRLFQVENDYAVGPRFDCKGAWTLCNSNSARTFSATAYFFAHELHEKLKVPIGLLDADYGGTVCEAWTSAEALKIFPEFSEKLSQLARLRDHADEVAREKDATIEHWASEFEAAAKVAGKAALGQDDSEWLVATNLGAWTGNLATYTGIITFRKSFCLTNDWSGRNLTLELGPVDDMDFTYVNGVKIGRTVGESTWLQSRTYTVPAAVLRPGTNVLTVCVLNTGGAGGIGGPVRLHPAGETNAMPLDHFWRYQVGEAYTNLPQLTLPPGPEANTPSVLFNAMIAPLIPYGMRGAIWYQGESNVGRDEEYRRLFPTMIGDWRQRWHEGNFPFYYVQIAPYFSWYNGKAALLREAQFLTLRTPHTGMAVTMDSDCTNLHPHNKQDVGHRLALWARAQTYGEKGLVYSGPLYQGMKVEGARVRLYFTHAEGGLSSKGKPLDHFIIAGADGKFVPATATIDGQTILVSSDQVLHPAAVRYAWGDADMSSFGNAAGLPAASFRTDAPALE